MNFGRQPKVCVNLKKRIQKDRQVILDEQSSTKGLHNKHPKVYYVHWSSVLSFKFSDLCKAALRNMGNKNEIIKIKADKIKSSKTEGHEIQQH